MNIAQRNGVVASVLTSGMVAEHHAAHIKQVSDGGHEIVGHAYAQNFLSPTMTADQDATSITQTTRLIEPHTDCAPASGRSFAMPWQAALQKRTQPMRFAMP